MATQIGNDLVALQTGGVLGTSEFVIANEYLNRSPSSILTAYLIDILDDFSRLNTGGDYPLYISHLPDVEDICAACFDTDGILDSKDMGGGTSVHQGVQLRVRNRDYETGRNKIDSVAGKLDMIHSVEITSDSYTFELINANRTTSIVYIGTGPNRKRNYDFTVNYLLTIKEL